MKTLLPPLFFCCSVVFAFGQLELPKDYENLSIEGKIQMDTLYKYDSEIFYSLGYYPYERKREVQNQFIKYLKSKAIEQDLLIFKTIPKYKRKAIQGLFRFCYSKIDTIRVLLDDTKLIPPIWDECMPPPLNEPRFTETGVFIIQQTYSDIEKDSLLEMLFTIPNQHIRAQNYYLDSLENNPKHLDWAIQLAKVDSNYMVAVPLMKYRFEEEKTLILSLFKKWLYEAKEGSNHYHYLRKNILKLINLNNEDTELRNVIDTYFIENPNFYYKPQICEYLAIRKDSISLKLMLNEYNRWKEYYSKSNVKNKKPEELRYLSRNFLDILLKKHLHPFYQDLYYNIWFDTAINNSREGRIIYEKINLVTYLQSIDEIKFKDKVIQYLRGVENGASIKNNKIQVYFAFNNIIKNHPDSTIAFDFLLEFLDAKNEFVQNTGLNAAYTWIKKHKKRFPILSQRFYQIFTTSENYRMIVEAAKAYIHFSTDEEKQIFVKWYQDDASEKVKNYKELQSIYNNIIRRFKKQKQDRINKAHAAYINTLITTKNIDGLLNWMDTTKNETRLKKLYERLSKSIDTLYYPIYWKYFEAHELFNDNTLKICLKIDSAKATSILFNGFEILAKETVKKNEFYYSYNYYCVRYLPYEVYRNKLVSMLDTFEKEELANFLYYFRELHREHKKTDEIVKNKILGLIQANPNSSIAIHGIYTASLFGYSKEKTKEWYFKNKSTLQNHKDFPRLKKAFIRDGIIEE